jgi:hypothetical protein
MLLDRDDIDPERLGYVADHELDEQARSDRTAWLATRFGLS